MFWTIVSKSAVIGFRWTIYSYCVDKPILDGGTLELMYPGGVANGWVDSDHNSNLVERLLEATMRFMLRYD
jgi:hypothetical protein